MPPFPLEIRKIGCIWPIEEGGFGVTASMDATGQPMIGFYPLNPEGQPSGQETLYAHQRLMIRVVTGFDAQHRAIVVFADAEITAEGLGLRVVMPQRLVERGYDRYLFVPWNSPMPRLYEAPVNANWPDAPRLMKSNQ